MSNPSSYPNSSMHLLRVIKNRACHDILCGKTGFAGDIRLPAMLYAKVLKPPAHGAKLKTVDPEPCKQVAGVQVVRDGDLVAVLHELPDMAEAALAKIKADFEPSPSDAALGWQWDAAGDDALRMYAPLAKDKGRTITGLLRGDVMLAKQIDRKSV